MIKRRSFLAVAASCLVTATVLSVPFAPVASAAASTIFGFNSYVSARTIADQKQLGDIRARRMFVYWDRVEATQGQWDWDGAANQAMDGADEQYNAVVVAGFQPLIVVDRSPRWARDSGNPGLPNQAHEGEWAEFLQAVVQRYPAAIALEVWNEPNLTYSVNPVDPVRYTQILTQSYQTVKAVRPSLPVISGGLAPSNESDGSRDYQPYLEKMFALGAASAMDGIGIHIYPTVNDQWNPAGFEPVLNKVRAERDAVGATQKPIWITEAGESTSTAAGWPVPISEEQQALDLITIINATKADDDVAALMLHTVDDAPVLWGTVFGGMVYYNSGLGVFRSLSPTEEITEPKPAACAISQEFGGELQCSATRNSDCRRARRTPQSWRHSRARIPPGVSRPGDFSSADGARPSVSHSTRPGPNSATRATRGPQGEPISNVS